MTSAVLALGALILGGMPGWPTLAHHGEGLHLAGNNRLTIAMDEQGQLRHGFWPGPGYNDHIAAAGRDLLPPHWSILVDGKVTLPAFNCDVVVQALSRAAPVLAAQFSCDGFEATQFVFVPPDLDVIVMRLSLRGLSAPPPVFWSQSFHPEGRRLPHALAGPEVFSGRYPYRTSIAGPVAYQYGDGGAPESNRDPWIGLLAGAAAPYSASRADDIEGPGQALAVQIAPTAGEEGWHADLFIGFAWEQERVFQIVEQAAGQGFAALLRDTEGHWERLLGTGARWEELRENSVFARDMQVLLLSRQHETGLVMAAPDTHLHFANPALSAWTNAAFLAAGYPSLVERQLQSYADVIQAAPAQRPKGSLPPFLFTDGRDATPRSIFQVEASAWWLISLAQYAREMGAEAAAATVGRWLPEVSDVAAFLAGWTYGFESDLAPSYNPRLGHDAITMNQRLQVYLGLESARFLFDVANEAAPPGLLTRTRELDILIRFRVLNQREAWWLDEGLGYWCRGILRPEDPLWNSQVATRNFTGSLREMPMPPADNPEASSAFRAAIRVLEAFAAREGVR